MVKDVSKSGQKSLAKGKVGRKVHPVESKKAFLVPTYLKKSEIELLDGLMKENRFASRSAFLRKCLLDYADNGNAK
jgi:hypothetical protein